MDGCDGSLASAEDTESLGTTAQLLPPGITAEPHT
jgi:hypothetical protein